MPQINRPTRYCDHSATLIDNILTNQPQANLLSGIIISDISDHLPVFHIAGNESNTHKLPIKNKIIYKQIERFYDTSMSSFYKLQNITWPTPDPDDANSAFDKFNTTFQTLYNESFPTTVKKLKLYYNKYKPWITQGILKSVT